MEGITEGTRVCGRLLRKVLRKAFAEGSRKVCGRFSRKVKKIKNEHKHSNFVLRGVVGSAQVQVYWTLSFQQTRGVGPQM